MTVVRGLSSSFHMIPARQAKFMPPAVGTVFVLANAPDGYALVRQR